MLFLCLFLSYLTERELVNRNNPFLSTHTTALMSQTASVMLFQLSLFSSSLQLHLTALNIVAFCSTGSCRFCFSKTTWATGSTAYHLLVGDSSTYQVTIPDLQTGQTPQAGEAGKQKMQNTWWHKGSFTSASHALQSHCRPVLVYQWLTPLITSSKDFTRPNLSQSLSLASGFWCSTVQMQKFSGVSVNQTISHPKPVLQMNMALLPGMISCWTSQASTLQKT